VPHAVEEMPEQALVCRDPPDVCKTSTKDELIAQINAQLALVPAPTPSSSQKYNGYRHHFITVKEQHRFLILYNFLKRNVNSKIIVYFSTTKSTQFHAKLLDRLKFDVKAAHNGQSKGKFLDEFLAFSKQKRGVLCLPDFQGNDFAIPPSVSWIVQYEPPGDPGDYIFRVGRISSERAKDEKGGKALIFLTPNQFSFLDYFKAAHVKFYEYEIHKVSNVQKEFEGLVRKDDKLRRMGRDAYHSYLMSYASHEYRDVYDVHQLEKERVARSFGFSKPPSPEKEDKDSECDRRRTSSREDNRRKVNKKDAGDTWMGNREKIWKHANRHKHLMTKDAYPDEY
jgi:ATP-dependent RNA helicase DDX18/HAS1